MGGGLLRVGRVSDRNGKISGLECSRVDAYWGPLDLELKQSVVRGRVWW